MRDVSCINWWFTDCTRTCLPWSIHFQHHATSQKTPCSLHSSPTLFYTSQPSKMSCDSVAYKVKDFHRMATLWHFSAKFCTLKRSRVNKNYSGSKIYPGTFPAPVHDSRHCFVWIKLFCAVSDISDIPSNSCLIFSGISDISDILSMKPAVSFDILSDILSDILPHMCHLL